MAHEHNVQDTNTHFTIDKTTREISIQNGTDVIMQFDHNSERLTFEIPKEIDSHDMTKCNSIQVHYINIDSSTKESNAGVYEVTDIDVSPDDKSIAILSWLISRNATQFAGPLNFLIKFKCIADDGTVDYVWNTAVYKGVTVSNGMDNGETVVEEYSDILAQWEARIEALEQGVIPGGGNCNITRIESLEETGIRNLRELESGTYILYGYFNAYPDAPDYMPFDNRLVTVEKQTAGSHLFVFQTLNARVDFHEILVDESVDAGFTHTWTQIDLLSLNNAGSGSGQNPAGGGMSATATALLISILRNAVYSTDQSASITALESALLSGGSGGGSGGEEEPDEPVATTYTIVSALLHATSNNAAASVEEGASYTATITAEDGYTLDGGTVSVTMGGVDITPTAYANGVVHIASVTGNVIITVSAVVLVASDILYQLDNPVTFDGTSAIDTGVAPLSTNKDLTIAFKLETTDSVSPWVWCIDNAAGGYFVGGATCESKLYGAGGTLAFATNKALKYLYAVTTYCAETGAVNTKLAGLVNAEGWDRMEKTASESIATFAASDASLIIGGRTTTREIMNNVTVNKFVVESRLWTDDEITAYLQEVA